MRKNLESVPFQITLGRVPREVADRVVASGSGLSIKGRALLILSPRVLEDIITDLDLNAESAALLLKIFMRARADRIAKTGIELVKKEVRR
jgi:hypothetical protein